MKLSPFEVQSNSDVGYVASSSLAGSRINAELWEIPAQISVMTKEFLDDTGVLNLNSALDYAMNAAIDNSDYTGQGIAHSDTAVQIRGFVGAQLGRNYFAWELNSDRFNTERLDFSRGPNSVLFGLGSPGGIVNTTTKRARIGQKIETLTVRYGSFDDYRAELDYGVTLWKDKLAVRFNGLYQDRDGWREFDRMTRRAGAFAATYRPFKNTEIRLDSEFGDVDQVIALPFPAHEAYLGWINGGRVPATLGAPAAGTGLQTVSAAAGTSAVGQGTRLIWDPFSGNGPVAWVSGLKVSNSGSPTSPALSDLRASITDESIMPRNAAISGPGYTGDFHYYNYAAFVEQRIGENLALEAAFNRQAQTRFNDRPQGFGQINLKIDPNVYRPVTSGVNAAGTAAVVTSWELNPNFGKFYTESLSDHRVIIQKFQTDDYRLTLAYKLDLTKHNKWFGRHDIAALLSRTDRINNNDTLQMANITPAGNAVYPLDVTAGNNRIHRRTYIDFSNPDPRWHGMYDWKKYRLTGQYGVTEDWVRVGDASRDTLTRMDTQMVVLQSRWLDNRVIVTAGLRKDKQRFWDDQYTDPNNPEVGITTATRRPVGDPRYNEWLTRSRIDEATYADGDTRSYGVVVTPLSWVALSYNDSNSFRPQNFRDIFDAEIGNRKGVGKDYGLRFRFLDRRLHLSLTHWTIDDSNQTAQISNNFVNYVNAIWEALGKPQNERAAQQVRDTQTLTGKGNELEVTANLTPGWRLTFNVAQTEQKLTDLLIRNLAYIESHRAEFMANGSTPIDATGVLPQGAPVSRAVEELDNLLLAGRLAEGQTRRQLREYTANIFTTYNLSGISRFWRKFTVGVGAQYRGDAVVGYDTSKNNAPIHGGEYVLFNGMLRFQQTLWRQKLRFQFNIDNMFNEDELIVTDADQFREYRYIFQKPRTLSLQVSTSF